MLAHLSPLASDYGRSVDTLNFCTEVSNRKSDLSAKEAETEKGKRLQPWYRAYWNNVGSHPGGV